MRAVIDTIDTHYQVMGSGPAVVLLHGWGCDWQIWHPLIQALSTHYQLVIPDLPAFGKSAAPADLQNWNSARYAKWLEAFLKESLGNRVAHAVVGHSFGAKVAVSWAANGVHKAALKKLVLIGAAGLPDPLTPRQLAQQRFFSLIPGALKKSLPLRLRQQILQKAGAASDHLNSTPEQRVILQRTVRENLSPLLTTITTPTLLLWGGEDAETPLYQGRKFAEFIPDAKLTVIPGAGHFPFLEQPSTVIQELLSFLKESHA